MKFFSKKYFIATIIFILLILLSAILEKADAYIYTWVIVILGVLLNIFYVFLFFIFKVKNKLMPKSNAVVKKNMSKKDRVKNIFEGMLFLGVVIIINVWGNSLGINEESLFIPDSMLGVALYFILFYILRRPIFNKLIKNVKGDNEKYKYHISYMLLVLIIVLFLELIVVYAPIFIKRRELKQKNVVQTTEICHTSIVDTDIECRGKAERYKGEGCYSRLLLDYPLSRKCTECLIICE